MKPNWRVKIRGKISSVIWDCPISADDLKRILKQNFCTNDIEVIE